MCLSTKLISIALARLPVNFDHQWFLVILNGHAWLFNQRRQSLHQVANNGLLQAKWKLKRS